jgi:hypothetical protein
VYIYIYMYIQRRKNVLCISINVHCTYFCKKVELRRFCLSFLFLSLFIHRNSNACVLKTSTHMDEKIKLQLVYNFDPLHLSCDPLIFAGGVHCTHWHNFQNESLPLGVGCNFRVQYYLRPKLKYSTCCFPFPTQQLTYG